MIVQNTEFKGKINDLTGIKSCLAGSTGLQRDVVHFWLTNSALVYEPKCGGKGVVAGSQPMSTAVHRNPNKLWRSSSIFNLSLEEMRRGGYGQLLVCKNINCNFLQYLSVCVQPT